MPVRVHQRERVHIHRRRSSKEDDEDENLIRAPPPDDDETPFVNGVNGVPPRSRTTSTPSHLYPSWASQSFQNSPLSASPYHTTFPTQNGFTHPSSPLRPSFSMSSSHISPAPPPRPSHSRTLSIPSSFSSPLSASFSPQSFSSHAPPSTTRISLTSSASHDVPFPTASNSTPPPTHNRRHTRIHSRNLSVFFPRPNSLPQTTITEDGGQELEFTDTIPTPSAPLSGQLLPNFSFGRRPPTSTDVPPSPGDTIKTTPESSGGISRRGHHHKHSMSHNFFSFLEPGADHIPTSDLHTQPTPTPISPWTQVSSLPSAGPLRTQFHPEQEPQKKQLSSPHSQSHSPTTTHDPTPSPTPPRISRGALTWSLTQFVLGARMWVVGQQIGALSCTGLGYWVVFDAMGVAVSRVVPGWLAMRSDAKTKVRRPYGNARVETVLMFAQAVYLMFASVYVCKEAVEHLLLSWGAHGHGHGHGGGSTGSAVHAGAEAHHHHLAEEGGNNGVEYPLVLTFLTLLSTLGTAIVYDNHAKFVQIANNHIPPITTILRNILSPSPIRLHTSYRYRGGLFTRFLSNPFIVAPAAFSLAIIGIGSLVHPSHRRAFDLMLAAFEMVITFNIAYRTCVVLGAVLLQTSPSRGLNGGRMEAFLRAMKEIERHPKVLHLPAPHLWQLTPSYVPSLPSLSEKVKTSATTKTPALVATLELHVHADMEDEEVVKLTRWAWERCVLGLGGRIAGDGKGEGEWISGEEDGVEVTVGIVRG